MRIHQERVNQRLIPLLIAWVGLVVLSVLSVGLGEWFSDVSWLPGLVGAVIWLKAWLVAHYFLEVRLCHTFIRRMVWVFIAFAPVALVLTDMFAKDLVEILQL